jgi:hypothetical protein
MSAALDARTLGEDGQAIYARINACTAPDQLDGIMKLLWSEWYPSGVVTDSEAELLTEAVERRRPTSRRALPVGGGVASVGRLAGRVQRWFMPRKPQRSPDRKASRERRRMLGGSGCMPSKMGMMFTEGERAVLCIVASEVKSKGLCDDAIDAIAARAGVCRTTAQNAMHEGRRLGIITVTERPRRGMKSLTNIVRICSREWLNWIRRAPSAARLIGSNPVKKVSPTEIIDLRKQVACNGMVLDAPPDPQHSEGQMPSDPCYKGPH